MKIVQLQQSMKSAGSACLRLHNSFLERGIESTIICLNEDTIPNKNIIYLTGKSRILLILNNKIEKFLKKKNNEEDAAFTYPIFGTDVSKMPELLNSDVIYLHWVMGGFLNYSNLKKIFDLKKPVVIIMHDTWWITGGSHYNISQNTTINNCEILNNKRRKGLSYKGFRTKKKLYEKFDNLYFVSPSKWLLNCAKESELTQSKPLFYIPNVIGNSIFKPLDKTLTRKILGLPEDKKIICFGADSLKSPHKGWAYLLEALQILKDSGLTNIAVLIFGKGSKSEIESEVPFETYFLGFLNDEYSLSLVYNAANVFVISSLADNQPTVVMESLSCGTPVVGFKVGGIPDMIRHGENGYLANYKDAKDLASGIQFCLDSKIKGKILPSFEKSVVTDQHLQLIETILRKN